MKSKYTLLILFLVLQLNVFAQVADTEKQIEQLLQKMSLEEKIGQLNLRGTSSRSKGMTEELKTIIRQGKVGALLNITDTLLVLEAQRIAVEESPNHIPLIFWPGCCTRIQNHFPDPAGFVGFVGFVPDRKKFAGGCQ